MKYDYAVVIGRFQPFHVGHERVLKLARQKAQRLIVIIGSTGRHVSPKNPFTFEDRCAMITRATREDAGPFNSDVYLGAHDHPYNDTAWATEVRDLVRGAVPTGSSVCLVGFRKDASSYYQSMFHEWDYYELPNQYGTFNATDIRKQYFQDSPIISEFLHPKVRDWLKDFAFTDQFKWLVDETKYLVEYREQWGNGPFVTVDAVCIQSGHILLVTRRDPPYKGALAIPGGFLNSKERILDACLRELREETHVSDSKGEIPPAMLKSFITENKVYDAPERSERGRVITHAFKFEFPNRAGGLYKVRGDDDAEKAQWYSLSELLPDMFMDDHADIIQDLTGVKF
jgi:bifunctional NMN adenylyltransferase/nudix hydrolase